MATPSQQVTIFTAAMRAEFLNAYEAVQQPAPWQQFVSVLKSNARIEHYPFMMPTPAIDEYKGNRRVARLSELKYSVENREYDAAFAVNLRDIKDDQVGGFKSKPRELAMRAKKFPGDLALTHLSAGKTNLCFDGTAFFADTHSVGSGDNLMSGTATGSAGTYNLIVLLKVSPLLPLIYQDRMSPELRDDLADAAAAFRKEGRFWIDLEGACAYGRWQDAILMEFTAQPTLTELQTALGQIEDRFRTFQLPKALSSDRSEYVHEQLEFNPQNATVVCSTNLTNALRQVLTQPTIVNSGAAITNIYNGWASLCPTGYVNTVS